MMMVLLLESVHAKWSKRWRSEKLMIEQLQNKKLNHLRNSHTKKSKKPHKRKAGSYKTTYLAEFRTNSSFS